MAVNLLSFMVAIANSLIKYHAVWLSGWLGVHGHVVVDKRPHGRPCNRTV